jgi:outer membrane murein-binding lipoprotein Lpp
MIISIVFSVDSALLTAMTTIANAFTARNSKLDQILSLVQTLQGKEDQIIMDLKPLTAQVAQNTSLEASAVTLIQGIAAQLAADQNDPAAVAALSTQLNNSATALAAAITANTPAAPPTPDPPASPATRRA